MFKLFVALLITFSILTTASAAPPVREFDAPGAPPFKVLKTGENPPFVPNGTTSLIVNGDTVATTQMRTQPGKFTLAGDGLCVGWDSGDPVAPDYGTEGRFTGGRIDFVAVDVTGDPVLDLEREFQALLSRD